MDATETIYRNSICPYCKNDKCKMELLEYTKDRCKTIKCMNCKIDTKKIEKEARKNKVERKLDKIMKSIEYKN